jgi:DNA polymerase phi
MPLIEAIRSARPEESQFSSKTSTVINNRISKLKELPRNLEHLEALVEDFVELHVLARKAPSSAFESTLSSSSLYLSRVLVDAGRAQDVADTYGQSLRDFVTRKGSRLNMSFFQPWIKQQWTAAWLSRTTLVEICRSDNAVNEFRRMQAIQLLQDLLSQPHNPVRLLSSRIKCHSLSQYLLALLG